MILLLGATSYFGQAFARELRGRGVGFIPLSREALDYSRFELLFEYIRTVRPSFVINADGIAAGAGEVETQYSRTDILQANTLLPRTIGTVCSMTNTPWGHVSTAGIYNGAKVFRDGNWTTETDLNDPSFRRFFAEHPEHLLGFNETDEPNFSFRSAPCTYVAGTKALAEEWLRGRDLTYVWRAGVPFDEFDCPTNLLSWLQSYSRVRDQILCVSYLQDFVRGCLGLMERGAPFGIFNLCNPGIVTTPEIIELIRRKLKLARRFHFWKNDTEFSLNNGQCPHPSCVLDSSKMVHAGLTLRSAQAAVEHALEKWESTAPHPETGRKLRQRRGIANIIRLVQP